MTLPPHLFAPNDATDGRLCDLCGELPSHEAHADVPLWPDEATP